MLDASTTRANLCSLAAVLLRELGYRRRVEASGERQVVVLLKLAERGLAVAPHCAVRRPRLVAERGELPLRVGNGHVHHDRLHRRRAFDTELSSGAETLAVAHRLRRVAADRPHELVV